MRVAFRPRVIPNPNPNPKFLSCTMSREGTRLSLVSVWIFYRGPEPRWWSPGSALLTARGEDYVHWDWAAWAVATAFHAEVQGSLLTMHTIKSDSCLVPEYRLCCVRLSIFRLTTIEHLIIVLNYTNGINCSREFPRAGTRLYSYIEWNTIRPGLVSQSLS